MLKNQSSLSSAGTPRQLAAGTMPEQRASGHNPSAANFPLTASVCFITDTNDCSGNTFGDGEGYPNKPNPIDPIQPVPDEDKCSELGFKKTSCSEGYSPSGFCSYNSTYFKECVCSETCPDGYQDYPCGSGMLQADTVTLNCKTCYKCTACEDECPSGHTTESGSCRQASSYVTECGNKCYKVLDNSCKSGQLSAPAESGGYKNKIVSYTDCGNPCFQSYNDNCDTGYVKTKESGKCYETTAKYTDYGTACYKEKACCDTNLYKYTCGGTGYAGGSGAACDGKYSKCKCNTNYQWKDSQCVLINGIIDGLFYCNGVVTGVEISSGLVMSLKDLGRLSWSDADKSCKNYSFCTDVYGHLPSLSEFNTLVQTNMTYYDRINDKFKQNGGEALTTKDSSPAYYWTTDIGRLGGHIYVYGGYGGGTQHSNIDAGRYYVRCVWSQ